MRKKQNQSDLQRVIKNCVLRSTGTELELDDAFSQSLSQNFLVVLFSSLPRDAFLFSSGLARQKRKESTDP
jgi:hypothetical protein